MTKTCCAGCGNAIDWKAPRVVARWVNSNFCAVPSRRIASYHEACWRRISRIDTSVVDQQRDGLVASGEVPL